MVLNSKTIKPGQFTSSYTDVRYYFTSIQHPSSKFGQKIVPHAFLRRNYVLRLIKNSSQYYKKISSQYLLQKNVLTTMYFWAIFVMFVFIMFLVAHTTKRFILISNLIINQKIYLELLVSATIVVFLLQFNHLHTTFSTLEFCYFAFNSIWIILAQ